MRFAGTTILVTGAGRGLGRVSARALASEGARVIVHARTEADARRVAADVDGAPAWGDLASRAGAEQAARHVLDATDVLHGISHNAGLLLDGGVADTDPDDLRTNLAVHVEAPHLITQRLLGPLRAAAGASIVVVSSQLGEFATGLGPDRLAYRVSKAAASAFALVASLDLAGDRIRVNALHPGWVQTDMGGPDATSTVEVAAERVLRLLAGGGDGPSGRFYYEDAEAGW